MISTKADMDRAIQLLLNTDLQILEDYLRFAMVGFLETSLLRGNTDPSIIDLWRNGHRIK